MALEYSETDAPAGSFGRATSTEPVTIVGVASACETDVSKNAALIPPAFGSALADVPGTGERLTPGTGEGNAEAATAGTAPAMPPAADAGGEIGTAVRFTAVTAELRDGSGSLGTLSAPVIGLYAKIFEGTDAAAMRKGAGHFISTSIWDGNVAFAGHNCGVNQNFGRIHTLQTGSTITLTTGLGVRSYAVYSVRKINY